MGALLVLLILLALLALVAAESRDLRIGDARTTEQYKKNGQKIFGQRARFFVLMNVEKRATIQEMQFPDMNLPDNAVTTTAPANYSLSCYRLQNYTPGSFDLYRIEEEG